jgi:isoleucyl-tRNA synthetase
MATFIEHESIVQQQWEYDNISQLLDQQKTCQKSFNFMDGPPFCSGKLHMGSLSIGFIKDTVLRYKRMSGFDCKFKIGQDNHGLPAENMIMKLLSLNSKKEIEEYGVDNFICACMDEIKKIDGSWKVIYDQIGRTIDFTNQYKTCDLNYMESVWNIFSQIYAKGLIYEGFKVMACSYGCETSLSNFEAGLNYKSIDVRSLYVKFKVIPQEMSIYVTIRGDQSPTIVNLNNTYLVAWTTTAWTLPSNITLCVNPDANYVLCNDGMGNNYIVAEQCVKNLMIDYVTSIPFCKGIDLKGMIYEPLFDFLPTKYHKVICDKYVQVNDENTGTGIVHMSPSHGADDCRICIENGIVTNQTVNTMCLVGINGKFINAGPYTDKNVFDASKDIVKDLIKMNAILREQNFKHSYPHCYRTETPLIYMSVSSFFVEVSSICDKLVANNNKINWSNPEIGKNRFGNWISEAKDWCLSRNRIFGTPIPVWKSEDGDVIVIGSIDEFEKYTGERPNDLHINTVDKIPFTHNGKLYTRVSDVLDCWFESGCVPYASYHYPFENSTMFDDREFLVDFVAEGIDQTRGWFYTLLVISTIISNKPPFKNVICSGLILDEKGQKLSKKNGNFIDPSELITKYGADTIRVYILNSQLIDGTELKFNETDLRLIRQKFIPYMNAVSFYLTQKQAIREKKISCTDKSSLGLVDIWITERLKETKYNVDMNMKNYHINKAIKELYDFIEDFTNWYIKLRRDELKGLCGQLEQNITLDVLYNILYDFTLLCSPFMPFLSEHLYKLLIEDKIKDNSHDVLVEKSVHLCQLGQLKISESNITTEFKQLQKIIIGLREWRSNNAKFASLKNVINSATLYVSQSFLDLFGSNIDLIKNETNCLHITHKLIDELNYIIHPICNDKYIGKMYKGSAKDVKQLINTLTQTDLQQLVKDNSIVVNKYILKLGYELVLLKQPILDCDEKNIIILGDVTIVIDTTINEDVHTMSEIRKLVSSIQQFRKFLGLNVWQQIVVEYEQCPFMDKVCHIVTKEIGTEFRKFTKPSKETKMFKLTYINGTETYITIHVHRLYLNDFI